jgi:hypothetical protein
LYLSIDILLVFVAVAVLLATAATGSGPGIPDLVATLPNRRDGGHRNRAAKNESRRLIRGVVALYYL